MQDVIIIDGELARDSRAPATLAEQGCGRALESREPAWRRGRVRRFEGNARQGETIDNCQHVSMGRCTAPSPVVPAPSGFRRPVPRRAGADAIHRPRGSAALPLFGRSASGRRSISHGPSAGDEAYSSWRSHDFRPRSVLRKLARAYARRGAFPRRSPSTMALEENGQGLRLQERFTACRSCQPPSVKL